MITLDISCICLHLLAKIYRSIIMRKYIIVFIASCFIASCTTKEQYVYENVGTTQAVVVQKVKENKTLKLAKLSRDKKITPRVKQHHQSPQPKIKSIPKSIPSKFNGDMGTQDSDWIDINNDGTLRTIPRKKKLLSPNNNTCKSGCCQGESCKAPQYKKKKNFTYYKSGRQNRQESTDRVRGTLRRIRSLPK